MGLLPDVDLLERVTIHLIGLFLEDVEAADRGTWRLDKEHSDCLVMRVVVELVVHVINSKLQMNGEVDIRHEELELAAVGELRGHRTRGCGAGVGVGVVLGFNHFHLICVCLLVLVVAKIFLSLIMIKRSR